MSHARLASRRSGGRGAVALALLLAVWLAASAAAQGPPPRLEIRRGDEVIHTRPEPPGAVRVLLVGNSLTYFNELPWVFQRVVESRR